jgi:Tetratricopeptide repeat
LSVNVDSHLVLKLDALSLLLPDKPYFGLIERLIPPPGETCQKIAISLEKKERESVDKEIAKRRMRLGANLDQVKKDVKRETLSKSTVQALEWGKAHG